MNRKLKTIELQRMDEAAFKSADKCPVIVVLDNIRSGNNTGSVFRSADAFRMEEIYLCGITPCPPQKDIQKTAIGATKTVKWSHHPDTVEALQKLQADGYTILAIEQAENTVPLDAFEPEPGMKYALVLGNEVQGVQQSVIDMADHCLEIPQFGTKHSLNVSVCTGIVLWDLFSKISLDTFRQLG